VTHARGFLARLRRPLAFGLRRSAFSYVLAFTDFLRCGWLAGGF
jgi:hypothetical protein